MGFSSLFKVFACGLPTSSSVNVSSAVSDETQSEKRTYRDVDIKTHYDLKGRCGLPGSYGEVVHAVQKSTNNRFAVKWTQSTHGELKCLSREFEFLKQLDHPNIIKTYAFYEKKKRAFLVMEYACGGDLFDHIVSNGGRLGEADAARVLRQLLEALQLIHENHIAHCDIKPSNIMLTHGKDVKLIDFGCSQKTDQGNLSTRVGSPSYIAPEVIQGSYNERCDIWSAGVLLFVMVFGFNPFNPRGDLSERGRERALKSVMKGFTNHTFKGYGAWFPLSITASDSVKDLISQMLISDWRSRPTAAEVLELPFFSVLS